MPTALTDPTGHVPLAVSVAGAAVLVVVAIVALLAATGLVAARRRDASRRGTVDGRIRAANSALATARAADEGWDLAAMRAAALDAARASGITDPSPVGLSLVSVDDRPGVTDDHATFVVAGGGRTIEIALGRDADGAWRRV